MSKLEKTVWNANLIKYGAKEGENSKNIKFYKVRYLSSKLFFFSFGTPNSCYLHTHSLHSERGNIGNPEGACEIQGARKVNLILVYLKSNKCKKYEPTLSKIQFSITQVKSRSAN
jgi:hypothetical protein